jgi:NADPH-dependent 7-cyano-7-deazaguanine reductase QueF
MAISYSTQGASDETGLSVTVIRNYINSGELKARYSGTKAVIEHDELKRFISSLPTDKPGK